MTIDDLNKVLIHCKVKGLLEIQYLDITQTMHKGIHLYDYKTKKFISINDIIKIAKDSGCPNL